MARADPTAQGRAVLDDRPQVRGLHLQNDVIGDLNVLFAIAEVDPQRPYSGHL